MAAEMQAVSGSPALTYLNVFTNGNGSFQDAPKWSSTLKVR